MIAAVLVAMVAALVSAGLTRRFLAPDSWFHVLDRPNDRSLHTAPIPRGGGVAIVAGVYGAGLIASGWWGGTAPLMGVAASGLGVAVVSLADDRGAVSPAWRLVVHVLMAALAWYGGLRLGQLALPGVSWALPGALDFAVSVVGLVWLVNLYNFMDGMDGFAGGMAVFGFGAFALLGWLADAPLFAALSLAVAAAGGGFLVFNFPPARIFMGDTGASTLGFFAGALTIWGQKDGIFPAWLGVLIFSPFIIDATVTLFRRLIRGETLWRAHKSHYYQRLVQLGLGHRRTVLWEYALMAMAVAAAVGAFRTSVSIQWLIIVSWVLICAGAMALVHVLEARMAPMEHPR